jgi:hypothetical protein
VSAKAVFSLIGFAGGDHRVEDSGQFVGRGGNAFGFAEPALLKRGQEGSLTSGCGGLFHGGL